MKLEGKNLLDLNIEKAKEEKRMTLIKKAKNLAARPWDDTSSTFTLPEHITRYIMPKKSADEIAEYQLAKSVRQ